MERNPTLVGFVIIAVLVTLVWVLIFIEVNKRTAQALSHAKSDEEEDEVLKRVQWTYRTLAFVFAVLTMITFFTLHNDYGVYLGIVGLISAVMSFLISAHWTPSDPD